MTAPALPGDGARGLLLRLLLADDVSARQAAAAQSVDAWTHLLHMAEVWSVVPQLCQRIQALGLQVGIAGEFRRLLIETYARTASRAAKGVAAVEHLNAGGVAAAAFKGLAAMARVYRPAPNRSIKDADILVESAQLDAAIRRLAALGYKVLGGYDPARLDQFLANSPGYSGNRAIVLADASGFELDLHWAVGVGGLTPRALLERSETVPLLGKTLRIVGAADGLLLTSRHSIRENLAIDRVCRDLFDIRLGCQQMQQQGSLAAVLEQTCRLGDAVPLLAILASLAALDATDAALRSARECLTQLVSPNARQQAAQLQQLFFLQAGGESIDKDLVYLFHTRPLRQIVSGALRNWDEYRGFMSSMEEKLDGEAIPLPRRLWRLAARMKGFGGGSFRALRTLARLKHDP